MQSTIKRSVRRRYFNTMIHLSCAIAVSLGLVGSGNSLAQTYPSKPIKMVSP